jgi:hypothetical protein
LPRQAPVRPTRWTKADGMAKPCSGCSIRKLELAL